MIPVDINPPLSKPKSARRFKTFTSPKRSLQYFGIIFAFVTETEHEYESSMKNGENNIKKTKNALTSSCLTGIIDPRHYFN